VDYLTWSSTLVGLAQGSMAAGTSGVKGSREFWLDDGKVTDTALAGLAILGWSVKTEFSPD
jgi:hypothetical protein